MNDHSLQKHPEELCNSQFEHSVTTQISRCELLHTPNSRSQGGHPEGCNRTIWQIISCNSMFGCQKYMILSQAMNLQLSFNFCILKNVCKNWKSRIWKYPRHVGDEARASATPKKIIKKLKLKIKKKQGKNILLFYLHDTLCFKWAFYCHVMRETCMQCPLWENWEYRQFQSSERNAMVIFFSASEVLKFTEIWFAVYLFMPSSLFNGADYFFKWKESGRIIKLIIKA